MKLKPALEYEKLREDRESWNKIILHQDGKFYHAYEWSAWLIKTFVEREDGGSLNVLRYKSANSEYVIGGFPLDSLGKYIPDYIEAKPVEERCLSIEIAIPEDYDYEALNEMFMKWREECPVKESQKGRSTSQAEMHTASMGRSGLFSIASRVLSYPVENSTPAQNVEFISKLKQDMAALL